MTFPLSIPYAYPIDTLCIPGFHSRIPYAYTETETKTETKTLRGAIPKTERRFTTNRRNGLRRVRNVTLRASFGEGGRA